MKQTAVNHRKWRHFLINPSFQLRLALGHFLFLITVMIVLSLIFLSPFDADILGADALWQQYASAQLRVYLLERIGLVLIIISVISIGSQIVFSHRFCGPLVNMKHTFNALAGGDATREVNLRRKDFLKAEAEAINLMLSAVRQRIAELRNSQAEMVVLAGRLPDGPVEERLRECLSAHQWLLDQWIVIHSQTQTGDAQPGHRI